MDFLIKPCSFLFIIILTYLLKRAGLFHKDLSKIVMKIVLNVTLPAAAISAFTDPGRDLSMLLLVILGFGGAVGSYFLMFLLSSEKITCRLRYVARERLHRTISCPRRIGSLSEPCELSEQACRAAAHPRESFCYTGKRRELSCITKKEDRILYLIGVSGFNIGCYGMPVINAFFGSIGTITSIMFDIGNSAMMIGGNYAFTSILLHTDGTKEQIRVPDLLKRFFSSAAMVTYMVLLVFCIIGISIPQQVADFISPLASANAFLSMFMLGLLFTLPRKKADWKGMAVVLAFRFAVAAALSFAMFHILPFSLEVRRIVILLLFCPMGSMSPGFIARCGGDGELASFTNSMSTLASLVVMSALAGYFSIQ